MNSINNNLVEWISDLMSILMQYVCILYDWYMVLNWSPLGLLLILTLDDYLHTGLYYIVLELLISSIKITLNK